MRSVSDEAISEGLQGIASPSFGRIAMTYWVAKRSPKEALGLIVQEWEIPTTDDFDVLHF